MYLRMAAMRPAMDWTTSFPRLNLKTSYAAKTVDQQAEDAAIASFSQTKIKSMINFARETCSQ